MKYDPLKHHSYTPEQLEDEMERQEQAKRRPRKMRPDKRSTPNEGIRRHQPGTLPPFEES